MTGAHERGETHVLEVRQGAAGLWYPVVDGLDRWPPFATREEAWRYGRALAALDRTDGRHSLPRQEATSER